MAETIRYNHLNKFLKDKFGERVLKICIDGGFSCPNRDGKVGKGGCIFCSERGSGDHLKNLDAQNSTIFESISNQVKLHLNSYRGQRANKFIAYFQNYTNTYDSIQNLKAKYDSALISPKIVGLAVATRPDCINEEIASLLGEYTEKYFVIVELGLQTANDETEKILNRGYTKKDFENAVKLLKKFNIHIVCHIMIGLPNETQDDLAKTIDFINHQKIDGVKIHSTYVVKNTKLAEMFYAGKYQCLTLDEYIDKAIFAISHLKKDLIIHRVSGDAPKDLLVAPDWNAHKKWIINGLEKKLNENNIFQGMFCDI